MNILIINQPLNNRGDESAHKALVRSLSSEIPHANIKVLFFNSHNKDSINQFDAKLPNVEYHNEFVQYHGALIKLFRKGLLRAVWLHPVFLRKVIRKYQWADVVVCAPGGICMGGFQDWSHLFSLHIAKMLGKPLCYYGRSFGPFPTQTKKNVLFKKKSLEVLNYFCFLSIRDKKTEVLADELGVKYISTVDTAFLDDTKVCLPYELRYINNLSDYMVFVPNYLLWHYAYKGKFTLNDVVTFYSNMARIILRRNEKQKIIMLPQTFEYGTFEGDDIHLFRKIAEEINDDRVIVLPDCYSSDIQQQIISHAKYVVGVRYHSIVFAINQNVPFISLSYEHKMSGLLETLGSTDMMIDFTHSLESENNRKDCLDKFERMLEAIKHDTSLQGQAKAIAQFGFERFKETLNNV